MAKKTKIVATLGLVSDSKEVLKQMIENGMNVARLNFSHGSHEWHGNVIKIIRELSQELDIAVGILADLQGPRIRTVVVENVEMKPGEFVLVSDIFYAPNFQFPISNFQSISNDQISNDRKFSLDVEKIIDDVEVGNEILIEDGLMKIVVKEKNEGVLLCEVIDGGTVKNHKGVNIPDAKLQISPITEKDEKDLAFVLSQDVDFVAMSFVSTGANIETLRDKMKNILGREDNLPQIIAKIERKEAIKNLDDIIEHTDAIMVARGDLGIEIEGTKVAILQKEIVKKSLQAMKPVIVATQMLDSMIVNPRPTRAEVSDVTNAVVDHADAVMLSGESASGKYPVESVRTMKDIIENTEASPFDDVTHLLALNGEGDFKKVIKSAYELAKSSSAKAVVLGSASGFTARLFSHFRPEQTMLVVTHNKKTYYQLSLVWGINAKLYERGEVFREDIDWLISDAKKNGVLETGDKVVLILGRTPDGEHIQLVGIKEI
ncbi:MAG TPA: pyruvate kinase [Candidatus Moranbacteria bacterium]|nr:pyruvate kinase [Candidatus Moranbacteria bacterium]HBT46032.1 pyruvate kinase [Candidatus Moranbacteria bacterium]